MSSGGPPELTFDEFRNNEARQKNRLETQDNASNSSSAGSGIRNRKSAAAAAAAENKSKTEKRIDKDDDADGDDSDTSRVGGIGDFLELPQVQSFVVCVLIADAFITIAILLLGNYIAAMDMGGMTRAGGSGSRSDSSDPEDYELLFPSQHATLLLGLLSTQGLQDLLIMCSTMSLVFFAMEISMVLFAFGGKTVGHWGYLLDACIVGYQIWNELFAVSSVPISASGSSAVASSSWLHLLNILRYWRLLRLISQLIGVEQEQHAVTKQSLDTLKTNLKQTQTAVVKAEMELNREKEARTAVDEMLMSSVEEVATLNEALKIAAMDIAEVAEADDDLLSDEDAEYMEEMGRRGVSRAGASEVDDEGFSDAAGSSRDKSFNTASMLREARKDGASSYVGGSGSVGSASRRGTSTGGVTFVVKNDGSYEQK